MHFLDLTLSTPAENLALDEALLLDANEGHGGEVLRVWEWPHPAVVLGAGGVLAADVDEDACRAADVPILRRNSGGGTVLLGTGCLLFSLILNYEHSPALCEVGSSYDFILGCIRDALADIVPGASLAGTSDLAVDGQKFSGNAQQRKREALLHHGTLLYHFDLDAVGRFLRSPSRQPAYRQGREHAAFLMNLPLDQTGLKKRLRKCWQAVEEAQEWPRVRTEQLAREKYTSPEWIRRR